MVCQYLWRWLKSSFEIIKIFNVNQNWQNSWIYINNFGQNYSLQNFLNFLFNFSVEMHILDKEYMYCVW